MPTHSIAVRREIAQRQTTGPFSMLRPGPRRVTFEIVTPQRSPQVVVPEPVELPTSSPASPPAAREVSWPSNYPTCQLRQMSEVRSGSGSESNSCPDPEEHDIGALLIRRAHYRHRHAWTRNKSEKSLLLKTSRSIHLQCLISGLLFLGILVTYLVLNFNVELPTAVSVLFVLLLLLCGIVFIHGLFRGWLWKRKARWHQQNRNTHRSRRKYVYRDHRGHSHRPRRQRNTTRTYRYTDPESPFDMLPSDDSVYTPTTPVRVHLFRDEESCLNEKAGFVAHDVEMGDTSQDPPSASSDNSVPTPPPPAYGLWRCSVRADPNLLHWQRCHDEAQNASTPTMDSQGNAGQVGASVSQALPTNGACRPPSYVSEHNIHVATVEDEPFELHDEETPGENITHSGRNPLLQTSGEEAVLSQDDWPLRRVSGAVQEVTRMLLADTTQQHET